MYAACASVLFLKVFCIICWRAEWFLSCCVLCCLVFAEGVVVQLQNLIDVGVLFKRCPRNLDALFLNMLDEVFETHAPRMFVFCSCLHSRRLLPVCIWVVSYRSTDFRAQLLLDPCFSFWQSAHIP